MCEGPEAQRSQDLPTGVAEAECRIQSSREIGTTEDCGIYPEGEIDVRRELP